jgi:hypothetical protein
MQCKSCNCSANANKDYWLHQIIKYVEIQRSMQDYSRVLVSYRTRSMPAWKHRHRKRFPRVATISCAASQMGSNRSRTRASRMASISAAPCPVGSTRSSGLSCGVHHLSSGGAERHDNRPQALRGSLSAAAHPRGENGWRRWIGIWSRWRRRQGRS